MKDRKKFAALVAVFLLACFLPFDSPKVASSVLEAFRLLQWYALNHTLACVVPAMFIAGAISTFLSQASVMRYLGPRSRRSLWSACSHAAAFNLQHRSSTLTLC